MPYMRMEHSDDPAETIRKEMGDINDIEIFHNQVLGAIYIRPEKTKSGLYLSAQTRDEDKYQGKVGLIIKKGADAFVDDSGKWFKGVKLDVGDWIYRRQLSCRSARHHFGNHARGRNALCTRRPRNHFPLGRGFSGMVSATRRIDGRWLGPAFEICEL